MDVLLELVEILGVSGGYTILQNNPNVLDGINVRSV